MKPARRFKSLGAAAQALRLLGALILSGGLGAGLLGAETEESAVSSTVLSLPEISAAAGGTDFDDRNGLALTLQGFSRRLGHLPEPPRLQNKRIQLPARDEEVPPSRRNEESFDQDRSVMRRF